MLKSRYRCTAATGRRDVRKVNSGKGAIRRGCCAAGLRFATPSLDLRAYKERQYDQLADIVRAGLDMELIYRIVRREV